MKSKLLPILFLFVTFFCTTRSYASHIAGGELTYTCSHDSTYHFIFKLYRDCSSTVPEPSDVQMCYKNSCNAFLNSIILSKSVFINGTDSNGTPVSSGCSGYPTTCTLPNSAIPGYQEFWYEGDLVLTYRCTTWTFSVTQTARNTNSNLLNASNTSFYVQATLNNILAQGNSSAEFTVKPVPYVCDNQPYAYNNGAYDVNNDSLGYQIIQPESENGCNDAPVNIQFLSGLFNLQDNPIATNNTFVLDTVTGQMNFTPSAIGSYTLTLRVTEYRNHVAISSTMRDIQVHVIACNISSPVVEPDTTTIHLVNGKIHDCGGSPLHFCFTAVSANRSAVLVPSDNHAIVAPGSTLTYTGAYTNSMYGCFSWSPTTSDTGIKILTITVTDSSCAPPGITEANSFTLPLYIFPVAHTNVTDIGCLGSKFTLAASGVSPYTWIALPGGSPVSALSCTNCQNPIDSPTIPTTYIATSTSGNGCPSIDTIVVVTALPPPYPSVSGTSLLCLHDTLKLYAGTTAPEYSWTGPAGFQSSAQNPLLLNFQQADTGKYYVVTQNTYCTSPPDSIYVNIYPPTYSTNADTTICQGGKLFLYGVGDTYIWSVLPGGSPLSTLSCTACTDPLAIPTLTTSYVISSNQMGCNTRDTVVVTVLNYPAPPSLSSNTPICVGDTLKLYAGTTATTYSWTGPGSFSNNLQNPVLINGQLSNTGTYHLIASNGPCMSTDSTSVVVVHAPPQPVVATNSPLCVGSVLSITPQSNQNINYSWTGPNGFVASSPVIAISEVSARYAGTYTVTGTYPADGLCVSPADTFVVVIKPKVYASFQFLTDSICQGYPVTINYSTPGADSVIWSFESGTAQSLSANPLQVAFTTSGYQTVTLNAFNGVCADTAVHKIDVLTTPPASFTATPVTCPGAPVIVNSYHDFTTDVKYIWNFGPGIMASGSNAGVYTLYYATPGSYVISLVTKNTYCTSLPYYDTIVAQPYPDASIVYSDVSDICSEDSVHFEAAQVPGYHYQWRQPVFFNNDTLYGTYALVRNSGYIYLDVTDQYGCTSSDSLYITPHPCCNVYFSNAFTPNGDGKNDVFKPITIGHHDVAYFRIFNRWGQLIFSSSSENNGWDGTVDGKPADLGTYFYSIRYQCVNGMYFEDKGEVVLIR